MSTLYLAAILPPPDLARQIHEIKMHCSEKFGVQRALHQEVYISLYKPFHLEEDLEKRFIALLKSESAGIDPFIQYLENFTAFDTHAVAITAIRNEQILALHKAVSRSCRRLALRTDMTSSRNNLPFRPHVMIAYRDILPEVFHPIWDEYKDQRFKRNFEVREITLLKHDRTRWIHACSVKLHEKVKQGLLFS